MADSIEQDQSQEAIAQRAADLKRDLADLATYYRPDFERLLTAQGISSSTEPGAPDIPLEVAKVFVNMRMYANEAKFYELSPQPGHLNLLPLMRREGEGMVHPDDMQAALVQWQVQQQQASRQEPAPTEQRLDAVAPAPSPEPAPASEPAAPVEPAIDAAAPVDPAEPIEPEAAAPASGTDNLPGDGLPGDNLPGDDLPGEDHSAAPEPAAPVDTAIEPDSASEGAPAVTAASGDPVNPAQVGDATWFDVVTQQKLDAALSGKIPLSTLEPHVLMKLFTLYPNLMNEPDIQAALGAQAARMNLTLEQLKEGVSDGTITTLKDEKGDDFDAQDRITQIVKENSSLFGMPGKPETGIKEIEFTDEVKGLGKFNRNVLVLHGYNGNMLVDDGVSQRTILATSFKAQRDGREIVVPDQQYEAVDAIRNMNHFLNKRLKPNADGSPQVINMKLVTEGWTRLDEVRDLDMIAALYRANKNNQKLNMHLDLGLLGALKHVPKNADGTVDFSRYKFNETAKSKMLALYGIDADKVVKSYYARLNGGMARNTIIDLDAQNGAQLTPEGSPSGSTTPAAGRSTDALLAELVSGDSGAAKAPVAPFKPASDAAPLADAPKAIEPQDAGDYLTDASERGSEAELQAPRPAPASPASMPKPATPRTPGPAN